MKLQPQQQEAFKKIQEYLSNDKIQVFILKGYAGTGKTTMVKTVIEEVQRLGKDVLLLAPTGRAAKVMREKTHCEASTVHSAIYCQWRLSVKYFDEKGNEIDEKSLSEEELVDGPQRIEYYFDLKRLEEHVSCGNALSPTKTVIIVDEASMISSKKVKGELFHFGSDVLIDDLLAFAQLHHGTKIIFVGDPAQLPPVGDNCSKALNQEYFKEHNIEVDSFTLTEVLRQGGESTILNNAMTIRSLLGEAKRNTLSFQYKPNEFEPLTSGEAVEKFVNAQPLPEIGDDIMVCFSNAQVMRYNRAIRQIYFPGNDGVHVGDVLQIVKNDYNHKPILDEDDNHDDIDTNLYNGDFIKVLKVSAERESQKSFMLKDQGGEKKERIPVIFHFRDLEFITSDGRIFSAKILENLLESERPSLLPEEYTALYINLKMRHPKMGKDKNSMALIIHNDPYFNALHVKYGYAVTGHKSQGGEWLRAYVDYSGRWGLNDDSLRWMYTATTRATQTSYAINAPNITAFDSLKINPIKLITKAPKNIASVKDVVISGEACGALNGASPFRRRKFDVVQQGLRDIGCSIVRVDALQYCDRYTIHTEKGTEVFECWYNDSGMYSSYQHKTGTTIYSQPILDILQDESSFLYDVQYVPSMPSLAKLFSKVRAACDELGIQIMNVQEFTKNYYVLYSFKTSGRFSIIQFYFKGNGNISYGNPSSDLGDKDQLLLLLVDKLSQK